MVDDELRSQIISKLVSSKKEESKEDVDSSVEGVGSMDLLKQVLEKKTEVVVKENLQKDTIRKKVMEFADLKIIDQILG